MAADNRRSSLGPALPAERSAALGLVFQDLVGADEAPQLEAMVAGPHPPPDLWDGLWVSREDGRITGAAFAQRQPGNVALVWFPRTATKRVGDLTGDLLQAVIDFLAQRQIALAQCMLKTCTQAEDAVLKRGGFRWLANLFYLLGTDADFPQTAPQSELAFEAFQPERPQRLMRLVERTYHNTLDCPGINGLRSIEDVMAGYRAAGVFDPGRWLIAVHQGQDVGCLILADYPDQENWELVYMGVVPEGRGHGWGLAIVRQAQWLARQAGRPRIVLAVDAANRPAIQMYTAAGFRAWDRRSVYLRTLAASATGGKSVERIP